MLVRLWGIERFAFEQDELYSVIEARELFNSPLNPGIEARPLYYLLQHPLLELMPLSHVSMRLLPLIFGILGIAVTWFVARQVAGSIAAGVAALLVAMSPWHIHASGMARYWSLIYVLSALSYWLLLTAYHTDRKPYFGGALVVLLLGTATHPTFLFPLIGFVVGLSLVGAEGRIYWRWPTRNAWSFLWTPFLLSLLFGYTVLSASGNEGAVQNWGPRGGLATARLIAAVADWSTPTLLAAGGLGIVVMVRVQALALRRFGVAALFAIASGLVLLVGASAFTSVYADYAISMLPLLMIGAGTLVALAVEQRSLHRWTFACIAALVLLAGVMPATASHLSDGTRFDYRPAFRAITSAAPELPVLTLPIIVQRHYAPDLHGIELLMDRSFLDEQLRQAGDLWVIVPVRRYGIWHDSAGDLAAWLPLHCRLTNSYQKPRFDYRMYRTDLYRCSANLDSTLSGA